MQTLHRKANGLAGTRTCKATLQATSQLIHVKLSVVVVFGGCCVHVRHAAAVAAHIKYW